MNAEGLRPHQPAHVGNLVRALGKYRAALDASQTGTGKTFTALATARELDTVPLVVGPYGSRATWENASALMKVPIEYINYETMRGRRNEEGVTISDWIEEVKWGSGSYVKLKNNYDFMIFDEVHRCSGGTSRQSKTLIAAKRQAHKLLMLSATAADSPLQMKALGYALGLHGLSKHQGSLIPYWDWCLRHGCKPGYTGRLEFSRDDEKQSAAFKRIHDQIFPLRGARMRKADIPGFPKTQIEIKMFEDPEANLLTWKIHEHFEAERAAREEDSLNNFALEESIRMRQALELLFVPYWVDLAKDHMEQGVKVVFFVTFTETLQALLHKLPGLAGYIDGTQDAGERERTQKQFQRNVLDFLVVNSAAGGESLSMHDPQGLVDRATYISPVQSGRQLEQILGRVNRDGGAFSIQYLCYFRNTYHDKIVDRLLQKHLNVEIFNDRDLI